MLLNGIVFNIIAFCATFVMSDDVCGKTMYTTGLIIHGNDVNRGEWPFIAALFYTQGDKFFCAGTVITSQHVVSAAHCLYQKFDSNVLSPSELVVFLGKHNLNSTFERGSVPAYVKKIFVHPEWKPQSEDYDADISVIFLDKPVEYSNYISPVCWPFEGTPFSEGTIVSSMKIIRKF